MDENPNTTVITAAGGIVWRETEEGIKLALIHRSQYNDWTLPKGKLEPGESWQTAALREVQEETGCDVELGNFAGSVAYTVRGIPKVVLFWHMKIKNISRFSPNNEVDKLIWLSKEAALEKLNYETEKTLLNHLFTPRGNKESQ